MKTSEKKLIGFAMIAGGVAIVFALGLPQWDAFTMTNTQLTELKDEMTGLETQRETLNAQIALLEKNTDIPVGINIRTYTSDTREKVIKQQLNQVVSLATGAGNKFISLTPTETTPLVPAETPDPKTQDAAKTAANSTNSNDPNAKEPEMPAPILSTFGYEMAVRGTYDTVQAFLKTMADQKELVEINAIKLENELNTNQSAAPDKVIDPSAPIRLTAQLRLALQPRDK